VLAMHISDHAVLDAAHCMIDTPRLQLVGRMHAHHYVHTSDIFNMPTIPVDTWNSKTATE
jgi:hypothetical protein